MKINKHLTACICISALLSSVIFSRAEEIKPRVESRGSTNVIRQAVDGSVILRAKDATTHARQLYG